MAYEKRDNSGAMFPNRKKEKETHPDMTGDGLIGGKEYYISAWAKQDKFGKTFYSFSFKDKASVAPRSDAAPSGGNASPPKSPMDDVGDIPFAMCWEA
jgi:hypothetical protein